MAYSLTEIRTRTRRDPAAFLAECDEAYQARIRHAAGVIVQRMEKSPIVLLSGPSGSGKTTSALKLEEELERRGVNTHTVSLDNYFHAPSHPAAARTPEGDIVFESPRMLDMALLDETFTRLSQGEEVTIPRFEFSRQMRNDAKGWPLRLRDNEVAIFEGIHALNDDIAGRHPEATALYVSARADVLEDGAVRFKGTWMRITRRAVRDCNFRGTDLTDTLSMRHNVRRGEKRYISPYKGRAHIVVASSLPYEAAVFANYAAPLARALEGLPRSNPRWEELHDLLDAFRWFEPIDPVLVPPSSLIREFIGGGTYRYK